jgi:hypothetical protein
MDTKSLIKSPELRLNSLIEQIETENQDKQIIYTDDLSNVESLFNTEITQDRFTANIVVVLCWYQVDDPERSPDFIPKTVDYKKKTSLKAFSNNFLEKLSAANNYQVAYIPQNNTGFALAIISEKVHGQVSEKVSPIGEKSLDQEIEEFKIDLANVEKKYGKEDFTEEEIQEIIKNEDYLVIDESEEPVPEAPGNPQ